MPLADLRKSMEQARDGHYAMPSFNVFDSTTLIAAIEAATERGSPLAVAVDESHFPHTDFEGFVAMARQLAERAQIPVSVHVDHIRDPQTVPRAIQAGCSSILFDGYTLDYEEKVELTRKAAELGHAAGLTVEAELGHVGQLHGRQGTVEGSEATDPGQVHDFVLRTGIDVVAVSVGSTSGMTAEAAALDLGLLEQIVAASSCFFSMHGGSGIRPEQVRQAIELGVCKLSVFTRLANAGLQAALAQKQEHAALGLPEFTDAVRQGYRDAALAQLDVWGPGRRPAATDLEYGGQG
jgi:ketose-bisphosphate aldolase